MFRFVCVCVCTVILWTVFPVMAQEKTAATNYPNQVAAMEAETQAQVEALSTQAEKSDPAVREEIGRQIEQVKREGEIRRLEILLEWAQADGDAERISEAETALNLWRNPPQTQQLPLIPKDENPGSKDTPSKNTH